MNIIDNNNLILDKNLLIRVIKKHPLNNNLYNLINNLVVDLLSKNDTTPARIDLNLLNNNVTLFIKPETPSENNYEYILFHEFSHIADRYNPKFKYSNKIRDSLTNVQRENVMEIWNLYIDARLNDEKLFHLSNNCKKEYSKINGKLQELPHSIEGKLMGHISFLGSRGVKNAENIVRKIWQNPDNFLSYQDIIELAK